MRFTNIVLGALLLMTPCAAFSLGPATNPPDQQGFERILLPAITYHLQGNGGSVWTTNINIRNDADAPVTVFQFYCVYYCLCVQIECRVGSAMPPHSSSVFPGELGTIGVARAADDFGAADNLGAFLYVDRSYADQVHFDLTLQQEGEGVRDMGTEIPVIRENEMKSGPVALLGVPISSDVRTTLRLFAAKQPDGTQAAFRIQIFEGVSNVASADETRTLINSFDESGEFPDYAVIPNIAQSYPNLPANAQLRILITPLQLQTSYWAFASVADNVTQHVTTISPH